MRKRIIPFLCAVLFISSIGGDYGQHRVMAASNKKDLSKYLVYSMKDWGEKQDVEIYDISKVTQDDNLDYQSGRIYRSFPQFEGPSIMNVYEFTQRPSFAGKARSVTLSDKDLLPENLLKYNLQVGDTVITKSFTYEQDGNTKNGKEPIEWEVKKVQIIYTMYGTKYSVAQWKLKGKGANISANYYLVAKKTLDYDEYFKFETETKLYTGTVLTKQKYTNSYKTKPSYFKGFVFDSLQGADIDFSINGNDLSWPFYWNTCNTTVYTGMMSIYKFAGQDTKSKPTKYALSKGILTTKDGYVKYNWLYGVSPYLIDGDVIAYQGLSVSHDGKLHWNHPYTDMSGFRPEMTLWTGVDTAKAKKPSDKYDITIEQLKDGTWRKNYEINYDVWKKLEDFVIWKID